MNLKNIKITRLFTILLLLTLFPILEACSSDILKEENIRIPVADVYYTTPQGIEDLSNSAYSYLRNYYGTYNSYQMNILGTDLWLNGGDGSRALGYYTVTPDDGTLSQVWDTAYLGITACNTLINRVDGVEGLSQSDHDNLLGQAYYLRALYYHILVTNWGGVPLELEEITEVKTTAIRASEEQVYTQIIDDLLKADQLLPITQSDYGRATKPAAEALMARVYLYMEEYGNAETYAKKVINDYNFDLLPDYGDIFSDENNINAEVIWAVQYSEDQLLNGAGNIANSPFLMRYDLWPGMMRSAENGRPFRHYMPSRYLLDLMASNMLNDSRFDKSFKYIWYANNPNKLLPDMVLGDTALYVPPFKVPQGIKDATASKYTTLDIDFYFDETSPNGEVPKGSRDKFPSLKKWHDKSLVYNDFHAHLDFFVFRLSEMYLIAAEALMNQDNPVEGVEYINKVRRRAAFPGKELDMELTASQLNIDTILEERALELAGECVGRWFDLKRTGKLLERVNQYNPDARVLLAPKHLLRPIPQSMIDRITNKDEFSQNPGY